VPILFLKKEIHHIYAAAHRQDTLIIYSDDKNYETDGIELNSE